MYSSGFRFGNRGYTNNAILSIIMYTVIFRKSFIRFKLDYHQKE